jgi:alpha-tubulin suppressor-like RCC1 family protein
MKLTRKPLITAAALALTCTSLLAAAGSAVAATSGTVAHWGTFGGGGGSGNGGSLLSPVTVSVPGTIAQIGTSNSTQYALLTNGTLWAWGLGTHGQLGDGGTTDSMTKAVQVQFPAGVKIASVPTDDMPYDTAYAIDTTGHLWGWGINLQGELCLGNKDQHDTPVQLPFTDVTTLAGAANHTSIDAGGTVYSCGQNSYGELGNGTTKPSWKPVKVTGLPSGTVALVAGFGNTGALLADGDYYDWGLDSKGQLGDGIKGQTSDTPVQVSLPGPVSQAVEGGNSPSDGSTLVMLANGDLYAWGDGGSYQLGTGTKKSQSSPVAFSPPAGVTYKTLMVGGIASYAISTTGDVYAWGANSYGQIGDGTRTLAQTPVKVESGASYISSTSNNVAVSLGG